MIVVLFPSHPEFSLNILLKIAPQLGFTILLELVICPQNYVHPEPQNVMLFVNLFTDIQVFADINS